MFKVSPVTNGSFAGLWCIHRLDVLAGFVGCREAIDKIRQDWIAKGLREQA